MFEMSSFKWMKRCLWLKYAAAFGVGILLVNCGGIRKLRKSDPDIALRLPAKSAQAESLASSDTARAPKIISFRKADGTEMFFTPMTIDTATGEKIMTVAIDEVVISALNRRNLVERNGKINIEFVVTVPPSFQDKEWRLLVDPQLKKGSDTLSLDPLVYTGNKFRSMQEQQYSRYEKYLGNIVDSTHYFDAFGRKYQYAKYMNQVRQDRMRYTMLHSRIGEMTPDQAMCDPLVGWSSTREQRRLASYLRGYVRFADRSAARNTTYISNTTNKFDHLNDYFSPRYKYEGVDVLPGGEVYTRIEGKYPDLADRNREDYLRSMVVTPKAARRRVKKADKEALRQLAAERMIYTGYDTDLVKGLLRQTDDSTTLTHYRIKKGELAYFLQDLNQIDTVAVRQRMMRHAQLENNRRAASRSDAAFSRMVRYPYPSAARLDTVIYQNDGSIQYLYSEQVEADENTSRLHLFLRGGIVDRSGRQYDLRRSDTLNYTVASMTTFLDETPRYMQRIITRDAEANARFYFTFPVGKSTLSDTMAVNRRQLHAVKDLTRSLMTDPIYIIDSITLRATSSPEGTWAVNDRLARERAEALRQVLVGEFRILYDSLKISVTYSLDGEGKVVANNEQDEGLPDLPHLLRTKWLAEDWPGLCRMIEQDPEMPNKEEVLAMIDRQGDADKREWDIRAKYPKAYERIRAQFYPQMRAVDFRFNLHRRGMQQDTVYTTEIDSQYMHAVELLKKRRYEEALKILRTYEDRNTALAYMSLGYDAAAYRILRNNPSYDELADVQYMLAILASRQSDEEQAVQYFLRSVELRENLKFRGNLDPEISRLIRKYGLFREDFY